MAELEIASFAFWSVITAVIMAITGFSYKRFIGKRKNEISSS